MTTALVIGRFQPLHIGHLTLFNYCESTYSDVTVVLGKSPTGRTKRNPLLVSERKKVIKTVNDSFTVVSATEDFTGEFTQNVISNLNKAPSEYTLVSLNETTINELTPVFTFEKPLVPIICRATEIRNRIVRGEEWEMYIPTEVYQLLQKLKFEEKVKKTHQKK